MIKQIRFFLTINIVFSILTYSISQDPIFKTLTALQCDSLVNANSSNPNFVILDVRTPAEYIPEHLEGAINRNYYNNFDEALDLLNKGKTYLIHCKSGSRSAGAFTKMQAKNFAEVYNMQGGITAWKNASLPTTDTFAPLQMLVSADTIPFKEVNLGNTDTIIVTLTNRANDTLRFNSVTLLSGSEFISNFDPDTTLFGADDYSFTIIYEPADEIPDTLIYQIESNGGSEEIFIFRNGLDLSPVLAVNSSTFHDFGDIYLNKSDSFLISVTNSGLSDLVFTEIVCCISPQFSLTFDIDTTLSAGEKYEFYTYFSPMETGLDSMPVIIKSNGGNVTMLFTGNGISPSETSNLVQNKISLFPNPATDYIEIENIPENSNIEILSLNGRQIIKRDNLKYSETIDISSLNSGIYLLKIVNEEGLFFKRFVVEKGL